METWVRNGLTENLMEKLSGTFPLGKYLFRVTNRDVKKSTGEYIFKFINKSDLLTHFLPILHLYTS